MTSPPLATDAVLQLVDVVKEYPGSPPVRALDGVTLTVNRGELVAVVGASGSGKSTLLNIMGTLDRPSAGEVILDGLPIASLSDPRLAGVRAHRIGFVFQQFHLLEHATAQDNVATALTYRGVTLRQRRAMAAHALERVGLAHRMTHRPPKLSGGERQRVAIARAIVGEPALVLADEPTGNLDSRRSAEIIELIESLNADGATIVIITHDNGIAARMPRRVTIGDGRILTDTGHGGHTGPTRATDPARDDSLDVVS